MAFNSWDDYSKEFPIRKSLAHLREYIAQKEVNGWELVGEIKITYNGQYQCMLVRKRG